MKTSMMPHVYINTMIKALVLAVALGASAASKRQPVQLRSTYSSSLAESIQFLKSHMPAKDASLSEQYITRTAELALAARTDNPWAANVPWDMFLDYVLPYCSLDEPREDWRSVFYDLFKPMVAKSTSLAGAALLLNRQIWSIWGIHFKADQAPEILSPSQVIKAGYGSCSALSIFLVNACRAVGIPARVAGTPSWVTSPSSRSSQKGSAPRSSLGAASSTASAAPERFNNHNWVEVWDGSAWSFMGAAEWVPEGFNRTWFFPLPAKRQVPGSLMNAIYAATFRPMACQISNESQHETSLTASARSRKVQHGGRQLQGAALAAQGAKEVRSSCYFPLAWDSKDESVPAVDVTQSYLDLTPPELRPAAAPIGEA